MRSLREGQRSGGGGTELHHLDFSFQREKQNALFGQRWSPERCVCVCRITLTHLQTCSTAGGTAQGRQRCLKFISPPPFPCSSTFPDTKKAPKNRQGAYNKAWVSPSLPFPTCKLPILPHLLVPAQLYYSLT